MTAVNIRVAEALLPFFETAFQALGATEINRTVAPDDAYLTIVTVDMPGAPAEAHTMDADLTFATGRPVHIETATYLDVRGTELATVTYP